MIAKDGNEGARTPTRVPTTDKGSYFGFRGGSLQRRVGAESNLPWGEGKSRRGGEEDGGGGDFHGQQEK